jgi:putative two-component system response regulator
LDLSNAPLREALARLPDAASPELLDQTAKLLWAELSAPSDDARLLFDAAYERLRQIPASLVCSGRVVALLGITNHYFAAARPAAALAPATDAVACARELPDTTWLCKSLRFLGTMRGETGNTPGAIECFAEALQLARAAGDVSQQCALWVNTGLAYLYSAQYADALAAFEYAMTLAAADPELARMREAANGNIAVSSLHLGDFRRGLHAAREAVETAAEPERAEDMVSRVLHENYYTRLLLEVDNVPKARERCRIAKDYAHKSKSDYAEMMASIAEGLTEVHAGNIDLGLTRLKRALERARGGQRAALHDALHALVRGYEYAGQPDAALVYLRELKRLHQDGRSAQVLLHHEQHLRRVDRELDTVAEFALDRHQKDLRSQLSERDLMRSRVAMLEQQSVAAELHDDTTGEHCYRVGRLSSLLAAEYGVDDHTCFLIDLAARMHDIGKLAVPDSILLKPGRLTPEERSIMETHTTAGADLLAKSNIPQMYVAEEIARHHHERYDGNGYPARLRGSMIPLAARITALADVFDALTHVRPYKHAWTVDEAMAEIVRLRGVHFDPELTDLFMRLVPRLQREHGDLDAYLGAEAKNSPFIKARRELAAALKRDVNDVFDARR